MRAAAQFLLSAALVLAMACAGVAAQTSDPIVLRNALGMEAHILRTGASLQRLLVPDKSGAMADVVLGWDDKEMYRNGTNPQMGSTLGRVGGRIAGGEFTLDGQTYELDKNAGNDTMHGGSQGFDKQPFEVIAQGEASQGDAYVTLRLGSPAGQMGFPGALVVSVTYTLAADAPELRYEVTADSDAATPVSVYLHPYFNLAGQGSGSVLNHTLQLAASEYAPYLPGTGVPSGEFAPVENTVYDFLQPTPLGDRVDAKELDYLGGIDNVWRLDGSGDGAPNATAAEAEADVDAPEGLRLAGTLVDPASGRGLDIFTNGAAIIVYTGNWLSDEVPGKNGTLYKPHDAVAIEVSPSFPNAVNTPTFPSIFVEPGQVYEHTAVWRFYNATT